VPAKRVAQPSGEGGVPLLVIMFSRSSVIVLRAAAATGTVRRVVLTSSIDAIIRGHARTDQRVRTEADWSDMTRSAPYPKSKVYAERAAWDFIKDRQLELVTINPGLVLGPLLRPERITSVEVIRLLLDRAFPDRGEPAAPRRRAGRAATVAGVPATRRGAT
jgi:nucleoside-diphosphate-sugar epimerase